MDPNANLEEQRRIVARMNTDYDDNTANWRHDATRLAELVQALDGWLTNGGFLPKAWSEV